MRVLIDECLPQALRLHLPQHESATVSYAGFGGLKNGALLRAAIEAGFEVFITGDKSLQHEQNLSEMPIAIVALSANAWRVIFPHLTKIAAAVDAATPGSIQRVDCGLFSRRRSKPQGPTLS